MTARRKLWKVEAATGGPYPEFRSEPDAYRFVDVLRGKWAAGEPEAAGVVEVYFDRDLGFGWELNERIDFKEEQG